MNKKYFIFLAGLVCQLEIRGSYTTTFQCSNGSYALIGGADLTLEYDYGYSYSQVRVALYIINNCMQLNSYFQLNSH